MRYLLDTDICVYAMKGHPAVISRLAAEARDSPSVSVVTEAELRLGQVKSLQKMKALRTLQKFLSNFPILPWMSDAAIAYAGVRANLERTGRVIGPLDMLIAAHAIALNLTLVTNNEREFSRVEGLKLENWA